MITSFQELERHVLSHGLRGRIALANAQDEPALAALVRAQRAGAAEGTLIGPADEIARLLRGMGEQVSDYEIRAVYRHRSWTRRSWPCALCARGARTC